MNTNGNPGTLVAAHPGNTNAVKYGVHSTRLQEPRIAEIVAHLTGAYGFSIAERIAVEQVARCIATLEAIDRDLEERGLVDKHGEARSLLKHRSRISRELDRWLVKLTPSMERQDAAGQLVSVGEPEYVTELQHIGLGRDTTASARDRVSALKELRGIELALSVKTVTWHVFYNQDEEGNIMNSMARPTGSTRTETRFRLVASPVSSVPRHAGRRHRWSASCAQVAPAAASPTPATRTPTNHSARPVRRRTLTVP